MIFIRRGGSESDLSPGSASVLHNLIARTVDSAKWSSKGGFCFTSLPLLLLYFGWKDDRLRRSSREPCGFYILPFFVNSISSCILHISSRYYVIVTCFQTLVLIIIIIIIAMEASAGSRKTGGKGRGARFRHLYEASR